MQPDRAIEIISAALRDRPAIRGLFLSGSFGNGRADAYRDINFVLVCEDGPSDEIAGAWKAAIEQTGEIVMWWDRSTRPALINAITADWTRTDVIILKPAHVAAHSQASLRPLFDHDGLYQTLPKERAPVPPSPARRNRIAPCQNPGLGRSRILRQHRGPVARTRRIVGHPGCPVRQECTFGLGPRGGTDPPQALSCHVRRRFSRGARRLRALRRTKSWVRSVRGRSGPQPRRPRRSARRSGFPPAFPVRSAAPRSSPRPRRRTPSPD